MAGPRRRPPDPLPGPLGGIVIDGANVIASSRRRPIERLDLAERWCREFRPDLPVHVFIDHSTAMVCPRPAQATLRARCEDVTPGRARYVVTPQGESADAYLLAHAREHGGLVLSNDRFWDFEDLREHTIVVQFRLVGDDLRVCDEATWFRPGAAVRVPMQALRADPTG